MPSMPVLTKCPVTRNVFIIYRVLIVWFSLPKYDYGPYRTAPLLRPPFLRPTSKKKRVDSVTTRSCAFASQLSPVLSALVLRARTRGALASYSACTRGTLARASACTRALSKNTRV